MITQDEFYGRAREATITADYDVSAAWRLHTLICNTGSLVVRMPRARDKRIGPGRPSAYVINSPTSANGFTIADYDGNPITLSDGGTTLSPGEIASMYMATNDDDAGTWFGKKETVNQIFDAAPGEVLYSFGGALGTGAGRSVQEFNQQLNTWTLKTQTIVLHQFSAGFTIGTAGYYFGSNVATAPDGRNKMTRYDPDTHTARTDLPWGTTAAGQGTAVGGRGYVAQWALDTDGMREYDASGDSWTTRANKTTACVEGRAAPLDDDVYVFNGTRSGSQTNHVESYDPGTDTWSTRTGAPSPNVRDFGMFVAVNDRAYKVCGEVPVNITQDDVHEYDSFFNSWVTKGLFPANTQQVHGAAPEGDGFITQGSEGTTLVAHTREYNEATDTWTLHAATAPQPHTGHTELAIAP